MKNTNKFVNNKDFGIIAQSANLKKGGLAPGSKQREIIAAEQERERGNKNPFGNGLAATFKNTDPESLGAKKVEKLRKSVGWDPKGPNISKAKK